jgi:branched-subunit amino acid transport protein
MSTGWIVTLGLGGATIVIKALGPVLLGGRRLPAPALAVVRLLAPALLAALVVTQSFTTGQSITLDARAAGLAAAAVALLLRVPTLVVIGSAAAATALIRLLA